MINLLDINKAISNKIKESLIDTKFNLVKIIPEDTKEPLTRPSIKIAFDNIISGKFNSQCIEKTLTCRVYFFASDRNKYKIENLKMQGILENTFVNGVEIKKGFFINIKSVESEIVDTVLECSFDLYTIEQIQTNDNSKTIEELEFKEVF